MQALSFARAALVRDAKGGELGVLFAALVVAVTALTAVGFFTSRVAQGIREQAGAVLAADLKLESGRPPPADDRYAREAKAQGLASTRLVSFASVVFSGELSQLASVVGATDGYPLRGHLRIAAAPFAPGAETHALPGRGEAWADSRLLTRLGVPVGGTLKLGALPLRVAAVLDYRPDQGSGFQDLAPTLLINAADVAATRLLQQGSRASWSLLVAGPKGAVDAYEAWLRGVKSDAERLVDVGESSEQMKSAMERSARFLNLAALVTVLLAAVAVAMGARRFATRHLDVVALLKCMGASQRFVLTVTFVELALVALLGALAGTLLGFIAQQGLTFLVRGLVRGVLPPPTLAPALVGIGTALTMLLGFALAPLLELKQVPPARVLRRNLEPPRLRFGFGYLAAAAALALLLFVLVRDPRLIGYAVGGIAATGLILFGAGLLLVRATKRVRGGAGIAWRYGLASVARRGRESAVQIVAFGLGLTVLLQLALVRDDLLREWRASLPADAPNHFLINIAPGDAEALAGFFVAHGVARPTLAPWVRARLTAVNGAPLKTRMPKTDRGRAFAEREQNLSWSATLPPDNRVVEGRWWEHPDPARPEVSIASEFQEELGLKLGDQLSFDVAGEAIVARVTSVRKVRWDGFRPNFFLVFAPGVLDTATGTLMTSLHLDAAQRPMLAQLIQRFPSVTVFDIDTLIGQVRDIMDRAALAVEYVAAFTLLAGVVVLLAAIEATRDERRYESAVLRTLGASRLTVLKGVAAEFLALGLLAGVLAASAASIASWVLATQLFALHYAFNPLLWLAGPAGGALIVGLAGTFATRRVVTEPPATTIKET
ncbi:MAG TPA: FtsX-like permease family protein [Steroidobacteraceae bacterium]|nr:FtsX-like permease family protein [Steroidobacteraceae bacterium]